MHFSYLLFNEKLACLMENQQLLHIFFRVFSISQRTCCAAKITIFFEKNIFLFGGIFF